MYKVSSQDKTLKIKNFTDLSAWQFAHKLVVETYNATKVFPSTEQFGITNQMRRSAVSITSNIAEGFSRATKADKNHFYTMALGSLTELQSQLLVSRDVHYLTEATCDELTELTIIVQKLVNGLMKALRNGKGLYS